MVRGRPCVPSILGLNHYVTSERVLDDDIEKYPTALHGGNGVHKYVDVEAARCVGRPAAGLDALLREAWERYGLPMAITETHIDATREDQLRWLLEVWQSAIKARESGIERAIDLHRLWAVVNTAGYIRIDDAETEVAQCYRDNTTGPHLLALICAKRGIPLVTFSSDLVFDGRQGAPYCESDPVAPLNVYGRSKVDAELGVLQRHPQSLIIRTSALFGAWDTRNYLHTVIDSLSRGQSINVANDITVTPTYAPDLINATLDLLVDEVSGIWHLTNGDPMTWADLGLRTADLASLDRALIRLCRGADLHFSAQRPANSALSSNHPTLMPSLESGLERYFRERLRCANMP